MELLCLMGCMHGNCHHIQLLGAWARTEPGTHFRAKLFETFKLALRPEELALTLRAIRDVDEILDFETPILEATFARLSALLDSKDRDAWEEDELEILQDCFAAVITSKMPNYESILVLIFAEYEGEIGQEKVCTYWKHRLAGSSHESAIAQLEKARIPTSELSEDRFC